MGDISELRGLVTVGTFLGVAVLLIGWIPSDLYDSPEMRLIETPEGVFETIDIYSFAEAESFLMNETGGGTLWFDSTYYEMDVDIGNHDIDFYYKKIAESGKATRLFHYYFELWGLWPANHYLRWYDRHGVERGTGAVNSYLEISVIEENVEPTSEATSRFKASCDHTSYYVTFVYNASDYNTYEEAWTGGELGVHFGVNFDDVGTSYSAFDIIAGILFFSMPNTNVYINAMISIPIWIAVGYIIFILVLRAIGAIFGGGA